MVPDSVFIPAQLSVSEALSRVITPDFWEFVSYLWTLDDKAADDQACNRHLQQGAQNDADHQSRQDYGALAGIAVVRFPGHARPRRMR